MRKILKIGLPLLFVGLCFGAFAWLRQANIRLRGQIAAARAHDEKTARLRADNQRLQALIVRAQGDEGEARSALRAETEQARREVAELEQRAGERHAAKRAKDEAAAAALAANRDLTKGLMLLENCGNVGRSTPVNALQTLVWASLQGDSEQVENLIAVTGAARTVCEGVIATLSESERKKYPTPEKLLLLFIADTILNVSAVQVVDQKEEDPQHSTLTVARLSGSSTDLPMQLGPNGWQVAIADTQILKAFKSRLLNPGPPAPAVK